MSGNENGARQPSGGEDRQPTAGSDKGQAGSHHHQDHHQTDIN